MLLRLLISFLSASSFSLFGLWLLSWLWDYSHGPAEPTLLAQTVIWSVVLCVFILMGCCTYSLLNPHDRRARE